MVLSTISYTFIVLVIYYFIRVCQGLVKNHQLTRLINEIMEGVVMPEKTKVKILGISGSGRKANTYYAVQQALAAAEESDFVGKTEFINQCLVSFRLFQGI